MKKQSAASVKARLMNRGYPKDWIVLVLNCRRSFISEVFYCRG